ncbi:putative cellobiose dehydrogenase [Phaeomoniella chlamydospora]|uniref:Putative cellobiose dehydrogenase n=1 Tax=Phaeomoniella chlamydospora TaxID=158046 RepID=A0A0G2EM16_PHACM|nr:putative cellobiose dehydrogenase [Phaeomoniella chlamydospora]
MFSVILFFALALRAWADGVASYTDSNTNITFAAYTDSTTGYMCGFAMPETIDTDFIATVVAPLSNGTGWAGIDFGAAMVGHLLAVAWPDGNTVVSSFREATGYTSPSVYENSSMSISPIEAGTFVNSSHMSWTFVCGGCVTNDSFTFSSNDTESVFGWAFSTTAVSDPSDSSSALTMHSAGYGQFGLTFSDAQSAHYSTWAAMATTASSNSTTSTGSTSNSTSTGRTSSANITTTTSNTTYDYIIVGAGPAGLIVAERIAETGASVLLVERGEASTYSTGGTDLVSWNDTVTQYDVPALAYYLTSASDTSEYCTDTADQAGCLLGGGSMVNALMYVKPPKHDFDDKWPTGWKSSDVADAEDRLYARNPGTLMSSADGKRYDQGAYDVLSSFLSSSGWSSIDALEDVESKHDVFSHPPWNIHQHERGGPVKTYLPLAEELSNFHLRLNTKVVRAVRNSTWISGIEVETSGTTHEIINITPSTGKVILAAGALSTPRTLIYSGIGPTDQIETVQSALSGSVTLPASSSWIDLPVGVGLKDHPILTVLLNTTSNLTSLPSTAFTDPGNSSISLWAEGSGLLTQAGQRLNFWTSVVSPSDNKTRYIQGTCNSPADKQVKIKAYVTHGLTSSTNLLLDSTGENTVFESDPWLKTQGDIEAYEIFFDRLLNMTRSNSSTLTALLADGSKVPSNYTGTELYTNLKTTLTSGAHYVGTAKMGTDDGRINNGTSVVDTNTKVYGTDNLFVVDASIHPDLPTGNTQAIIMVAAEKAAEKILALDGVSIGSGSGNSTSSSLILDFVIYWFGFERFVFIYGRSNFW